MHELDETSQHGGIGLGEHAVAQVEDVPRSSAGPTQHIDCTRFDHGPVGEAHRRIEVALQRHAVAHSFAGDVELSDERLEPFWTRAEELDAMYPIYRLREAGYIADVAALTRRDVQLVIHDFDPESDAYTEKYGRKLPVDITFAEVDPTDYVGLVIPGGRAPEYIRLDADVRRITEYFFEKDLPVGTICHGPQVPAVYGLLRGRKTAAFPPLWGDMENAGAILVDAPDVVDGNMVSCRGWPDMPEWSRAFMNVLERAAVPA